MCLRRRKKEVSLVSWTSLTGTCSFELVDCHLHCDVGLSSEEARSPLLDKFFLWIRSVVWLLILLCCLLAPTYKTVKAATMNPACKLMRIVLDHLFGLPLDFFLWSGLGMLLGDAMLCDSRCGNDRILAMVATKRL